MELTLEEWTKLEKFCKDLKIRTPLFILNQITYSELIDSCLYNCGDCS